MKKLTISIVTVSLNNEHSIAYTLYSVFHQTYKHIEHVFVDGGSTDKTLEIIKKHKIRKKILISKNSTIYQAINLGIKKCSGDYVLILNTDDILNDKKTIENVVKIINKKRLDMYLGSVIYFSKTDFSKITRFYRADKFSLNNFNLGLMPPHPGCFTKVSVAKKFPYNSNFKIAADFDFFLRTIGKNKASNQIINRIITRMRLGGISGKDILAHYNSSKEIKNSLINNKYFSSYILIYCRFIIKFKQFFFERKNFSNFKLNDYYEKLNVYHFKLLAKINKLNFNKNFVLSALNLAFLGSYCANEIKLYKNLIQWPDGKFAKNIYSKLIKIPGRQVLEELIIPKRIKQITVFGNLPDQSRKFLVQKYSKKVIVKGLPYGSINTITKKFSYKIHRNEIIFITLPTPKQEQFAEFLILKNKNYRIICIGGSINIASGLEKKVPDILYNYEFLWRLRYETLRRIKRLLITSINFFKGKYLAKKLNNLNVKIIN